MDSGTPGSPGAGTKLRPEAVRRVQCQSSMSSELSYAFRQVKRRICGGSVALRACVAGMPLKSGQVRLCSMSANCGGCRKPYACAKAASSESEGSCDALQE